MFAGGAYGEHDDDNCEHCVTHIPFADVLR